MVQTWFSSDRSGQSRPGPCTYTIALGVFNHAGLQCHCDLSQFCWYHYALSPWRWFSLCLWPFITYAYPVKDRNHLLHIYLYIVLCNQIMLCHLRIGFFWVYYINIYTSFSPPHLSTSTLCSVPARIMTCQCLRSSAISVVIWFLATSSFTRSRHLSFGLPRFLFPSTSICNIFLVVSSLIYKLL